VAAFNLADELDSINFHSTREAVKDLEQKVFRPADDMRRMIRDLLHNLDAAGRAADGGEARRMYPLLDLARKCSVEPGSFRNFLDGLIPLIGLLAEWGDRGPIPITDEEK